MERLPIMSKVVQVYVRRVTRLKGTFVQEKIEVWMEELKRSTIGVDEGLLDVLPEWSGYSRIKPRMRNYVGKETLLPKVKVAELNILAHELKKEIVWWMGRPRVPCLALWKT